jgi:hypothetical protein
VTELNEGRTGTKDETVRKSVGDEKVLIGEKSEIKEVEKQITFPGCR